MLPPHADLNNAPLCIDYPYPIVMSYMSIVISFRDIFYLLLFVVYHLKKLNFHLFIKRVNNVWHTIHIRLHSTVVSSIIKKTFDIDSVARPNFIIMTSWWKTPSMHTGISTPFYLSLTFTSGLLPGNWLSTRHLW